MTKSRVFAPLEPIFRDPDLLDIEKMILEAAGEGPVASAPVFDGEELGKKLDELSVFVPPDTVFRTSGGKIVKIGGGDEKKKR